MLEKLKANIAFKKALSRPDITKAYALTDPSDSWYPTLKKVHESLAEVLNHPHKTREIIASDGVKLCAVVYPCTANEAAGTVIFIHGYTSHAEREWAFPALFYLEIGYNVVIPYQRAHGPSGGEFISFGAKERGDMLGWIDFAKTEFKGCPIIIHGLSMGGGIALQLSDTRDETVKAIIADAPSFGISGMLEHIAAYFGDKSKDKVYKALNARFYKTFGENPSVTDVVPHVKNSNYPIFLTAGSLENMEENLEGLKSLCPKEVSIVILPNCNHGNGMYKQTSLFQSSLKKFLDKYNP